MTTKIEKILVKYLTQSASVEDLDELVEWLQKPNHVLEFKAYIKTEYAINFSINNPSSKKALDSLLRSIRKEKSFSNRLFQKPILRYATAAIIFLLLSTTYFLKDSIFNTNVNGPIFEEELVLPGTDKAILTLDDGKNVTLDKNSEYKTKNVASNGVRIIYKDSPPLAEKITYNYLTVPRGGQFQIALSDGTQVWLNSESQLKYPVSFSSGSTRVVELIYGEAYFDVSSSENHNGSTFQVLTKQQKIEVLGTEFNIKAYRDETNIYTTLVEGKVVLSDSNTQQYLAPNQQSNYNLITRTINIANIDVTNEISWKEGVFSFEDKTLKEIMKVLSRWYDIEVVFENKKAEKEQFIGSLNRNQNINEILTTIKNFGIINSFTIELKKVTIQ